MGASWRQRGNVVFVLVSVPSVVPVVAPSVILGLAPSDVFVLAPC